MMLRRYRPRKEFKFWLYHDIEAESRLMEYIDYLRKTRQFARTIRNGLRLMWTLGDGDLSFLFELFPTLKAQLEPPAPPPAPPDNGDLKREIQDLKQVILSSSIGGSPNGAIMTPALPAPAATGKQLAAPNIAMPNFDDDDDQPTIILKRDVNAGATSTDNFLVCFGAMENIKGVDPDATSERHVRPH